MLHLLCLTIGETYEGRANISVDTTGSDRERHPPNATLEPFSLQSSTPYHNLSNIRQIPIDLGNPNDLLLLTRTRSSSLLRPVALINLDTRQANTNPFLRLEFRISVGFDCERPRLEYAAALNISLYLSKKAIYDDYLRMHTLATAWTPPAIDYRQPAELLALAHVREDFDVGAVHMGAR